ncbi:MAG TPA: YqgE/AlgH family protein [Gammaproteobacteria bacterium]|nr:YqgE/AlgH family protein [Gammaproteobacteria bacterium]
MNQTRFLANQFMVAMPQLADPNFFHTVSLICEHNETGAMGIVINRPLEISLADVLDHMEIELIDSNVSRLMVYAGGPVETERGFVIHDASDSWNSSLHISETLAVTTSRDILEAIARGEGPKRSLVALGYAGWAAGQLEEEIVQNAWLSTPVEDTILFDTDFEKRWEAAAALVGVNVHLLSNETGHA